MTLQHLLNVLVQTGNKEGKKKVYLKYPGINIPVFYVIKQNLQSFKVA
jgi:hypothetical protein